MADTAEAERSVAAELMSQHHASVEDAEDEDLVMHKSNASEEKTKAPVSMSKPGGAPLDTHSRELFPELGAPKSRVGTPGPAAPIWTRTATGATDSSKPANQDSPIVNEPVPRASTPALGANTPIGLGMPSISIPGRNVETIYLEPQHVLPRNQLKRPLADIIKDLNRKSRANINMSTMGNGRLKFEAAGPQDVAQQALNDLVHQIGTKQSIKVPIPQSARAYIIGKGGSTIKALEDKSRAKIQLPRVEDSQYAMDEDEDGMIDVLIEGNALSAAMARDAVLKIAGERAANVFTRLRDIPAEFYPFLAGPRNCVVNNYEEANGVQILVPPHQAWSAQPPAKPAPGQRPIFNPAPPENPIQLAGDRAAVQAARAEIERQVEELRLQLMLEQLDIQRGQHQFIIGDRGISTDEFFEDTGCVLVFPTDANDELVTVIGPPDRLDAGMGRAMDLAGRVMCNNYDISRFHRQAPGGATAHARNITRYLQQKREIDRLEKQFGVYLNTTPCSENGAMPWEIYSRDNKNVVLAKPEIKSLIEGHPPCRMANVPVDPFFHQHIRNEVAPRLRQDFGVQLVVPEAGENGLPVLLVYEGPDSPAAYEPPRTQPTSAETQEMQRFLREAQEYIENLVNAQDEICIIPLDVPIKFHDKLRKFIKREQEARRAAEQIPVRVSSIGQTVNLRGPKSAVESLADKCQAFIAQEEEDEKQRGFTMEFDFPEKYANHLVGKGGSHIRELKEKHDVEIQVRDGKVELQGPKAKAEACKSEILAFSRRLQDEVTHSVRADPKLHGSLIGPGGSNINRLQTRYNVEIHFPHSNVRDDSSGAEASDAGRPPRRHHATDEITIRGPKKGADAARDEILSLVIYLQENSHTAAVSVQRKQLPSLIGSGGTVMDQLRQTSGAKIDIPDKGDSTEGMVDIQIRGTKAQVAAAKKLLEEKKAVFDNTIVKTLDVDRKHHKALIGPGGATLRNMVVQAGGSDDRRELSRTIQFPKQESDANTVKVEGPLEVVDKIIAQIQSRVSEWAEQTTDILEVPTSKHRLLIGAGGQIRRDMETKFNVSIDIPRQGTDDKSVRITGKPDDVEKAKAHIQSVVADQPGVTIAVPRAMHHAISNNGQLFRKLRSDFHVKVDHAGETVPPKPATPTATGAARTNGQGSSLPLITDDADAAATESYSWSVVSADNTHETGDIPWVLHGSSADNLERARKAIETAIEQARQSTATGFLVLPDPKSHRYVIGQGGSTVKDIRKQSGCRITVPKQGQDDSGSDEAIEVVGTPEGVERAKELILEAVREGIAGGGGRSARM